MATKTQRVERRKDAMKDAPSLPVQLPPVAEQVLTDVLVTQAAKRMDGKLSSYWNPRSLTWWSGVASIAVGTAKLALPTHGAVSGIGEVVAYLAGGAATTPAQFFILGLGIIGIRAKLSRQI